MLPQPMRRRGPTRTRGTHSRRDDSRCAHSCCVHAGPRATMLDAQPMLREPMRAQPMRARRPRREHEGTRGTHSRRDESRCRHDRCEHTDARANLEGRQRTLHPLAPAQDHSTPRPRRPTHGRATNQRRCWSSAASPVRWNTTPHTGQRCHAGPPEPMGGEWLSAHPCRPAPTEKPFK